MRVLITIPVYNEEILLASTITTLHRFLAANAWFDFEIVIADNASTDRTPEIAWALCREFPRVEVSRLELKGRGRALKKVWSESTADILSYMDADLSTELEAFPLIIEALASGKYDLATGSRLLNPGSTRRSFSREVTSRGYNLLVKAILRTRFSDAQCGFKAITRRAANALLPLVEDPGWFFDTELLAFGEKLNYQLFDLPVRWAESQQRASKVNVIRTAIDDVRGLLHLRGRLRTCATARAACSPAVS